MNVKNLPSFMSSLSSPIDTVIIHAGRGMGVISNLHCRYIMLRDILLEDLLDLPYYTLNEKRAL